MCIHSKTKEWILTLGLQILLSAQPLDCLQFYEDSGQGERPRTDHINIVVSIKSDVSLAPRWLQAREPKPLHEVNLFNLQSPSPFVKEVILSNL